MTSAIVELFRFKGAAPPARRLAHADAQETERQNRLAAFEAMVSHDWDRFWRYAYRICGNADDAEDLLGESLLEAFQSFDKFRGEGFDKWLFRILTTNRIDMVRRAKVRKAESLTQLWDGDSETTERSIPDFAADPAQIVTRPLLSEDLQKALDGLSDDFRAVLLLCDVEQMDYHEIARTLGLPIGTVRSRIHRARTQMRRALEAGTQNR